MPSSNTKKGEKRSSLRKLIGGRSKKDTKGDNGSIASSSVENASSKDDSSSLLPNRSISNVSESTDNSRGRSGGGNIIQRLRERSRSRSRARQHSSSSSSKEMLVAVTSCRSDGYYNQKAPGSTFKLPRKAPTNLKLFHELAVGVKDAYAAVGATPKNPENDEETKKDDVEARMILWDFVGNLDFVSFVNTSV